MQKFTGKEYLMIDIANSFGHDKLSWNDRLTWFVKNLFNLDQLVPQAKDPAMFYAGVQAYHAAQRGEAIGYPISLDATSSGLQILAALTGDRAAASICNVIDTDKREDAYTAVFEKMVNILTHRMGEHAGQIKRDDVKQAVMTLE